MAHFAKIENNIVTQKNCNQCSLMLPKNTRNKYCSTLCYSKSLIGKTAWNKGIKTGKSNNFIHGHANPPSPTYISYNRMLSRCYDKKNNQFYNYGAKGILVERNWLGTNGFINFLKDMGERPNKKYSLDRLNVDGNYQKSNCRWATAKEQQNNKKNNHYIFYDGKKKTLQQWADELGFKSQTLVARINYYKWPIEKALTIKPKNYGSFR